MHRRRAMVTGKGRHHTKQGQGGRAQVKQMHDVTHHKNGARHSSSCKHLLLQQAALVGSHSYITLSYPTMSRMLADERD
eukprot:1159637-Pelagomonas_calceolata.AAC.6